MADNISIRDIRCLSERVLGLAYRYDTSNSKHTNEQTLFNIAMYTVRDDYDDDNVAWVASMKIRNPDLLTELALGATEYVVSEWAVSKRLEDRHLLRIIREIEDNPRKWKSPRNVEPDDAWGHFTIRQRAARTLRDRRPLVDIALGESDPQLKAFYIGKIAEQADAFSDYVQRETEPEALMVAAAGARDLQMLEHIVRKLDGCFAQGAVQPMMLTFNDTSFNMPAIKAHLRAAREAATPGRRHRRAPQKAEEAWARWDAMPEEERLRADRRQFGFQGEVSGVGWERAKMTVDGESRSCRISYIGNSVNDFLHFVDGLEDGDNGFFAWDPEGGICLWFIARRDPYVYAEIPDFENGVYMRTDTFRNAVLKDLFKISPLLKWY